MTSDVVGDFAELFRGNNSAYWTEGAMSVRESVTPDVWSGHLQSGPSIGIYPLTSEEDGRVVRWGCSDIDLPKMGIDPSDTTMARNLTQVLHVMGISSWVERSKSKGWHVWVFVDSWCPAEWMRNALLLAHQVAGVPPTEVNPKQVSGVELGNLVRLPYPGGRCGTASNARQAIMDPISFFVGAQSVMPLGDFVLAALANRNSVEAIAKAARLYVPPRPAVVPVVRSTYSGGQKELTDKLSPLAWTIFKEGPTGRFGAPGQGLGIRYSTLQRLAFLCEESGLTSGEAFEIVRDADARWGKFAGRRDCDQQLAAIISKAY